MRRPRPGRDGRADVWRRPARGGGGGGAGAALPVVVADPHVAAGLGLLPVAAAVLVGGSRFLALLGSIAVLALLAWGEPLQVRYTKATTSPSCRSTTFAGPRPRAWPSSTRC